MPPPLNTHALQQQQLTRDSSLLLLEVVIAAAVAAPAEVEGKGQPAVAVFPVPDDGLGFRVWGLGFGVWGLGIRGCCTKHPELQRKPAT